MTEEALRRGLSLEELADPPLPRLVPSRPGGGSPFAEFMGAELPAWALVRNRMDSTEIDDVGAAVREAMAGARDAITPGARVCLAAGSRGIDRIDQVVRAAAATVREFGGEPFVVPAMGSHGGATDEGQLGVLASYGITAQSVGCEIRSSMETVELGEVAPGVPVFVDRHAFEEADLVIPINRVKPHTDFSAEIESGLMKMIAIGLGKQKGADTFHRQGFATFHELIPAVAELTLSRVNIPFGLALVENGYARLWRIEAVPAARIADRERELLVLARERMGRIRLAEIDVLVVDELGKDISGLGMDSNVIGRYYTGPTGVEPAVQRIVVRGLTRDTEGNAVGLGMADVALRRAVEQVDARKTYMNCITAKTPEGARLPLTVETDREALAVAIACCLKVRPPAARIVRIRDTKHVELMYVSEPALEEALARGAELVEAVQPIRFDGHGMLADGAPWATAR